MTRLQKEASSRPDRHTSSAFVSLEKGLCQACWECVAACPNGVIGKVDVWVHRHAVIRAGDTCTGCGRCVKACPNGALMPIPRH
jgi:2-oxoglutarate ferredoxin oxidoreductase subunit delta